MYLKTETEIAKDWKGDFSQPVLSVVCITYNHENYISKAIDSFLMQETDFPFEIIIGDDCSNDSTATVVKKYAKKYPNFIHAITRENNLGAEANFRDCIDHSRSEIIAVCEGDDYWTDVEKLAKQYKFMVANPDYSFIFSPATYFSREKIKIRNRYSHREVNNINLDWVLKKGGGFYPTLTSCYRKKVLNIFPEWFYTTHSAGDYAIAISSIVIGKIGYIDDVMGHYRIDENSMSNKVFSKKDDCKKSIIKKHCKNSEFIYLLDSSKIISRKKRNKLLSKEDYILYAKLFDCGFKLQSLAGIFKIEYGIYFRIRLLVKLLWRSCRKF
jgi:glycosyltransferase involved in cell wall biosynthesis